MKGMHGHSRTIVLTICVILPLSLAEVVEYESFGFHLDSDGKRVFLSESDVELDNFQLPGSVPVMTLPLLGYVPCIAIVTMLPTLSPRRSGSMDACPGPPDEAGPGSSAVLRI